MGNCLKQRKQRQSILSSSSQPDIQGRVESRNASSRSLNIREKIASSLGRKKIKIVLVGDTGVGRTSLIRNYLYSEFKEEKIFGMQDNVETEKDINGTKIDL